MWYIFSQTQTQPCMKPQHLICNLLNFYDKIIYIIGYVKSIQKIFQNQYSRNNHERSENKMFGMASLPLCIYMTRQKF